MAQVLGRYHIISELGRGGMGVVYKALDPKLERFIAIKCLSDELSADEIVVARFLREARSVAALNHPNIAQIFVADEHEGKPYFVMEYVDGESLADFIDREGQCSPEMARRMTEQAANALMAAAEQGIVHRDVKPGNIMIDRRGRAVLTDFGIACIAAEQSESGSEMIMGTPGYLAPEALSGGPVDFRSDMFALGAVWYEMLTGDRLMPGRDLKDTYRQLAAGGFPDLSALEDRVDDRVVAIMRRLLAVQPDERFADWSAVLAEMQPLKTGRTGPVARSDTAPSTAEREVTEALATARTAAQAAPTATPPEATAVMQTESARQHPVPVRREAPRRRGRLVAVLLLAVLALTAAGFGLARFDPAAWNRVTAWWPSGSDTESAEQASSPRTATAKDEPAQSGAAADPFGSLRAGQALAESEGEGDDGGDDAGESGLPESAGNEIEDDVAESADEAQRSSDLASATERTAESDSAAMTETAAGDAEKPGSSEHSPEVAESDSEPSTPAEPAREAAPPPSGIVVIGLGDPVIADPMVREIEAALRNGSHPLIQRGLVRGYRDHIEGEEIDLSGLAGPALDAGARYVVVARALPAGERELQYYNRIETAYIAQLETVSYDLHAMQQLGASPVEQIEFTSLNATRRAVEAVAPWLSEIEAQFH